MSLFGHGCSKLGGMCKGFKKRNLDDLYVPTLAGFEHWLDFVLEPKNARVIKKKYAGTGLNDTCGLFTHRLMMLSFVGPLNTLHSRNKRNVSGRKGIIRFFNNFALVVPSSGVTIVSRRESSWSRGRPSMA
jgi:hypothetical protein